jgi:AcrR family transcriptional regulator
MGRPRDPSAHGRLLDATRTLLRDVGYQQLTMEAVALRAGVGKPTLYRRWHSKAE